MVEEERRRKALEDYRRRLIEHRELDAKLKKSEEREGKAVLGSHHFCVYTSTVGVF